MLLTLFPKQSNRSFAVSDFKFVQIVRPTTDASTLQIVEVVLNSGPFQLTTLTKDSGSSLANIYQGYVLARFAGCFNCFQKTLFDPLLDWHVQDLCAEEGARSKNKHQTNRADSITTGSQLWYVSPSVRFLFLASTLSLIIYLC